MNNNTKKTFDAKTFRSFTENGDLCKTFVAISPEEKVIVIIQRILATKKLKNFYVLRKYKHYYYCERYMSFHCNSFAKVSIFAADLIMKQLITKT